MPGKPNPKLTIANRQLEVRRLLRRRADPDEIIQVLKTLGYTSSLATYYRDVEALQAEDQQWIRNQAKGEFVSDYRRVLESLTEQVRQADRIRAAAQRPYDKLMATQLIAELEVQIADLLAQGPTVLGLKAAGDTKPEEVRH